MKKTQSLFVTVSRVLGKLLLILSLLLPWQGKTFAQAPALEFNVNGHAAINGPTVAAQTVTFQNNTLNPVNDLAYAVYNPPLTVTFDFTYQRFTPGGIGNAHGLVFGYNQGPSNIYPRMDLGTAGAVNSANFTSVRPANSGGIQTNINHGILLHASSVALQNAGTGSGRQIMGTLRITFNRPVTNPILHLENLGGFNQNTIGQIRYYSTEFDMTAPAGATFTELDGNNHFTAAGVQILNANNTNPDASDPGSANGSVMVNGVNITEILLNVFLEGTAGGQWASTATAGDGIVIGASLPTPIQLSGNVFNDANGLSDNTVNGIGIGTASGSQMYVNLFTSTGVFVAATPVAANGTYFFAEVAPSAGYIALISPTAGSPISSVPAGWVFTGENMGTGPGADGIVDGQWHFTAGVANLPNINFGIERIPTANPVSQSYITPSGSGTVVVPTLTGSDPENGIYPGTGGGDTIVINSLPSGGPLYYNGTAVIAGQVINGYNPALLTFDPPASGSFSFTFRERDAAGISSAPATVTLNFDGIPIAVNDLDTTTINVPATGDVSSNDTCGADGGCNFSSIGTPPNGTVTLNPTGTYTYTPNTGFTGVDSFRYSICDADGDCDTAIVTMLVSGIPVAVDDIVTTPINTPVNSNVSSNDICSGPVCTFTAMSTPPHGTLTFNPNGTYTYTPNTGFTGTDSFRYTICNELSACDTAWVFVTINNVLPVQLIRFTAEERSGCTIALEWLSGHEANFEKFEVERSTDASRYEKVAELKALGSGSLYAFQFSDARKGLNYFRLKMIDADNSYKYSNVISVNAGCDAGRNIRIYPMPTSSQLHIDGLVVGAKVLLYDIQGKLMTAQKTEKEQIVIDMSSYAAGMYILSVITPEKAGIIYRKIEKK